MSAFTLLASLLHKLVPATTRLVQAAKQSLRPKAPASSSAPPPIGHSGAIQAREYLRGAGDERWRQVERERLRWATQRSADAAQDEPIESQLPADGEPKP